MLIKLNLSLFSGLFNPLVNSTSVRYFGSDISQSTDSPKEVGDGGPLKTPSKGSPFNRRGSDSRPKQNVLLQKSNLYDVVLENLNYWGKLQSIDWFSFKDFYNAYVANFRVISNSATKFAVFSALFYFYLAFQFIFLSSLYTIMVTQGMEVRLPKFVLFIILKVSIPVKSNNKVMGFIKGELYRDQSLYDIVFEISEMDDKSFENHAYFRGLRSVPMFNTMVPSDKLKVYSQIRDQAKEFINQGLTTDQSSWIAILCKMFELIESHLTNKDVLMYEYHIFTLPSSDHFGIYRFKNLSKDNSIYWLNQNAVSNLTFQILEMFAVFLIVFKPTYEWNFGSSSSLKLLVSTDPVAGDVKFSLYKRSLYDTYLYIFGLEHIPAGRVKPSIGSSSDKSSKFSGKRSYSTVSITYPYFIDETPFYVNNYGNLYEIIQRVESRGSFFSIRA
jgi:hypothetical protein